MENEIQLSFIIPVYNEEHNIGEVLRNLHNVLFQHPDWKWEVVVIEDGSKDQTRKVIQQELQKYPSTQLILHEKNQGYTRSLKDGIAAARGRYLMYIGSDEEFDCSEIPSFIEPLRAGQADIVLGVRWQRNAYKLFRFFISVVYIFSLNYLFRLRINDYNWSQVWSKKIMDHVELRSKSLFVLPEIIIKAHDLGCRIKEVPSNHRGRQYGKSSVNLRIMGHALFEALAFWRYRLSPHYEPRKPMAPSPLVQTGLTLQR